MSATPTVLVYRDLKCGEFVPGSARVEEMPNAGAAIVKLVEEGWRYSGCDPKVLYRDGEGYLLHEVRLIY